MKQCLLDSLNIDLDKTVKRDGVDTVRVRCVRSLAEILFININRYKYDVPNIDGKDKSIVYCNEELDLNCSVYNSAGNPCRENNKYDHYPLQGEFVYALRGLLVHYGEFRGRGGGHYIALVCDMDNNWYAIDNDEVIPIYHASKNVNKYFGGANCVVMAVYVKHGFENKYLFNSNDNITISNNEPNDVSSNSNNATKQNRKRKRSNDNDVDKDTCRYNLRSRKNKRAKTNDLSIVER